MADNNWRERSGLYAITELRRNRREEYTMIATGDEVRDWLRAKREANGYVPGCGGDRQYECIAVLREYL